MGLSIKCPKIVKKKKNNSPKSKDIDRKAENSNLLEAATIQCLPYLLN